MSLWKNIFVSVLILMFAGPFLMSQDRVAAEIRIQGKSAGSLTNTVFPEQASTGYDLRGRTPRFGLGIYGGFRSPANKNYEGKTWVGGTLSLTLLRNLFVEIGAYYGKTPIKEGPGDLSRGTLTMLPLTASLFFRLPVGERIYPYVGGGVGYYTIRAFDLDSSIKNAWDALGFDITESVENTLGYHVGGGGDIHLSGKVALNLDVRYCVVEPEGEWKIRDQISGEETRNSLGNLDFNAFMAGIGLKIMF